MNNKYMVLLALTAISLFSVQAGFAMTAKRAEYARGENSQLAEEMAQQFAYEAKMKKWNESPEGIEAKRQRDAKEAEEEAGRVAYKEQQKKSGYTQPGPKRTTITSGATGGSRGARR